MIGLAATAFSTGNVILGSAFTLAAAACVGLAMRAKNVETKIALAPPVPVLTFPEGKTHPDKERLAYVENVGGTAARNVQVQPIEYATGRHASRLTFHRIGLLKPGERVPLELESASAPRVRLDLTILWRAVGYTGDAWLGFATQHQSMLPIIVTFRDALWRECIERQTLVVDEDGNIKTRSNTPRTERQG